MICLLAYYNFLYFVTIDRLDTSFHSIIIDKKTILWIDYLLRLAANKQVKRFLDDVKQPAVIKRSALKRVIIRSSPFNISINHYVY